MKNALNKLVVKKVYNKTAGYYDLYHRIGTYDLDNRGRKYLVNKIVKDGDLILDAGGGTGTTTILALKKGGQNTRAVILDISENMLKKAKEKAIVYNLDKRISFKEGDMYDIPYPDNHFDAVISTYSTCPLENPANAVGEMLRVLKINGLLGIAHSCDSKNKVERVLSNWIESVIWKFPMLSLGCRKFDLSEDLKQLKVNIIEDKTIGFIPWFFKLLVLQKKANKNETSVEGAG